MTRSYQTKKKGGYVETVQVNLYNINRCGYYKDRSATCEFGSITQMLTDMKQWSDGRSLEETMLLEGNESGLPVYLASMHILADHAFFTMWNQVPADSSGAVQIISGKSKVGMAKVSSKNVGVDDIPGFPTYFYLNSTREILVALRLTGAVIGHGKFREYCEEFQASASTHTVHVVDQDDDDSSEVFYRKTSTSQTRDDVSGLFRTTVAHKGTDVQMLIDRAEDIRKMHKRAALKVAVKEDRDRWQNALKWFGIGAPAANSGTVKLNISTSVRLDATQVMQLISDHASLGEGEDYGFTLKNEQNPIWLNGSTARGELRFNTIERESSGLIDGGKMLQRLNNRILDIVKFSE